MGMRILICTSLNWPFAARLAQAFGVLGARVEALCPRANPLRQSAAPTRVHAFSFLNPLPAIAAAIEAAAPDLIVPCDDLIAEMLWRLGDEEPKFAPLLRHCLGEPSIYSVLASRNQFQAQAAIAGASIAQTVPIDSQADLDRALVRLGLPLVVKTDGSWGGEGVVIAHDIEAAKSAFASFSNTSRLRTLARSLKRGKPHFLVRMRFNVPARLGVQRFVAGHPATSSIACWRGKLLASNHFNVAVSNGATGPATIVTRTNCPAMEMTAARLATHFGLSGLYGLDYIRGVDGRIFLLEINPRATPTAHLALGPGHDLAAALLSAAGHPAPDRPAITQQARIALFPQEVRRDPQSPHLVNAYHDLPLGDPTLAKALTPRGRTLTSFSRAFSGLSELKTAPSPPGR
jgi:hypothetical protein